MLGEAICLATRIDAVEVCGVQQLCAGASAGIVGAVHAMNELLEENRHNGWDVLLIDAENAFNSYRTECQRYGIYVSYGLDVLGFS